MALEPLLRKLEHLRDIPFKLGCRGVVSAFANNVTTMVSGTTDEETVGIFLKEYESVAGANINAEKSVGSQLGTWRGRVRVLDCFMGI